MLATRSRQTTHALFSSEKASANASWSTCEREARVRDGVCVWGREHDRESEREKQRQRERESERVSARGRKGGNGGMEGGRKMERGREAPA
jgi:hypothetical protein